VDRRMKESTSHARFASFISVDIEFVKAAVNCLR
jgi:hypothetical protein